ncbi:DapH/DapD/GlmU-related protein [Paenibacillus sp. PL91]|jgi:acetyltransferase-like isoleucine patch superfamily enzyme|uniref:DapH/DapD/GlmU-related protein n=1 Tax=Paenibacillus sp. PL91 TaxID=2729538 RepID=UPI00145DE072|nr:DapH/DapD/GlmU-related protein [Paenibacillus sp. PL91]MBC9202218.1 acetyltransferase [Paenibacillus sp. PL91]
MSTGYSQISFGKLLAVLKGAAILPIKTSSVGRLGRISGKLSVKNKGRFFLGKNVSFQAKPFPSSITVEKHAELFVGDNVFFNYGLDIGCTKSIQIGSNTIIGPMVNIIDTNFHPVDMEDRSGSKDIVISDNVWIGRGAVILPGVTIGQGSVIAAGSIVTRDIPANVLAGGTPAKVIRELQVTNEWIRRYN